MPDLEKHIKRNVINGRSLFNYERVLGFNRKKLEGHRVLNFGSGGSNIGKELKSEGINCEIIDVDVLPNPHSVHEENHNTEDYTLRKTTMERKVREYEEGQLLLKPIEEFENNLLGIEGRNFVQLDKSGRLPFPDNHFDEVFVSWVFHQLPEEQRDDYLREFMRVGKRIYISPIGRRELRSIQDVLLNSQFEIESILHYGEKIDKPISVEKNREKGLTDDGYIIYELDIDYSERPYSVSSAGCASIILKKRQLNFI